MGSEMCIRDRRWIDVAPLEGQEGAVCLIWRENEMSAQQKSVRYGQRGLQDRLLANLVLQSDSLRQVMVCRQPKDSQISRDEKRKD